MRRSIFMLLAVWTASLLVPGSPATAQGASGATHGAPNTAQDAPAATHGAPTTGQDAPFATDGAPTMAQGAAAATHEASATPQGAPAATCGAPTTGQDAPAAIHGAPATAPGVTVVHGAPITTPGASAATPRAATPRATTPAEYLVAAAERSVAERPDDALAHADLAMAFARRARERHDPQDYERGLRAVEQALALSPANPVARRARVWVLLGQHEFTRALDEALALAQEWPDDALVLGSLVDAHVELGHYGAAERAAQRLLDLAPGSVAALTRAAYLRELFGDIDGALDLMQQAHRSVPARETEDRAWVLTQIGHLQLARGEVAAASAALEAALATFPGYHYALAGLARVRTVQGEHAAAVDLYRARYRAAPHPECLFDLAAALERAGRRNEARASFERFEREALAESEGWDNANRELIRYYVDHAGRPEAALPIAERERARRRDVYTLDAYGWTLHALGRTAEARRAIAAALAVGVRDPEILDHAAALRRTAR